MTDANLRKLRNGEHIVDDPDLCRQVMEKIVTDIEADMAADGDAREMIAKALDGEPSGPRRI